MKEATAMRHPIHALAIALLAAALASGCGEDIVPVEDPGLPGSGVDLGAVPPSAYAPPATDSEAARFLNQATFGANDTEIAKTRQYGYSAILQDQFLMPTHRTHEGYINTINPTNLSDDHVMHTFWRESATGWNQLRRRVAFALSQILVISLQDANLQNYRRGVASYLDMLTANAFGNYRQVLQDVTLHPMMGIYLSHLRNRKEDPATNRVPDQNYAREVMQLFSIGLYQLNPDGTQVLDGTTGLPIETYGPNDIVGLSRVFTGFSWAGCPNTSTNCFNGSGTQSPNREVMPMQAFPQFHSTSQKDFLGTTIPANATPDPMGDLNTALDTIFNHPNIGPFIGRQLIQRLVTSNPSPGYVGRVAQAFNTGRYQSGAYIVGTAQRGDLRATVAAILLDPEARTAPAGDPGKVREPVLRLAQWMRAFNARSASGNFLLGVTDDPATQLGQSPMRSPTVFNFYRPGYVPPNTAIATAGLVAPELQIVNEIAVIGYSNYMRSQVQNGSGSNSPRDIQPDYTAEMALADNPAALVDRVGLLLTAGTMSAGTRTLIINAVNSITMPATNQTTARLNRARLAVFFTLSSPDYLVQK
jgi:uncharacterized protein (DUF1800 family)